MDEVAQSDGPTVYECQACQEQCEKCLMKHLVDCCGSILKTTDSLINLCRIVAEDLRLRC